MYSADIKDKDKKRDQLRPEISPFESQSYVLKTEKKSPAEYEGKTRFDEDELKDMFNMKRGIVTLVSPEFLEGEFRITYFEIEGLKIKESYLLATTDIKETISSITSNSNIFINLTYPDHTCAWFDTITFKRTKEVKLQIRNPNGTATDLLGGIVHMRLQKYKDTYASSIYAKHENNTTQVHQSGLTDIDIVELLEVLS